MGQDVLPGTTLRYRGAVYIYTVIGPVCLFVCGFVGLHDNSKLRESIFTKVKVVTISSWLNFGRPALPGMGLRRCEIFWLRLTTARAQCLRLSGCFLFSVVLLCCQASSTTSPVMGITQRMKKSAGRYLGLVVNSCQFRLACAMCARLTQFAADWAWTWHWIDRHSRALSGTTCSSVGITGRGRRTTATATRGCRYWTTAVLSRQVSALTNGGRSTSEYAVCCRSSLHQHSCAMG